MVGGHERRKGGREGGMGVKGGRDGGAGVIQEVLDTVCGSVY